MFRLGAKGIALSLALVSATAFADFLPKNDLHFQDNLKRRSNVTKQQFEAAITKATSLYEGIVDAHGGQLFISGDWDDSTVNAGAIQFFGTWFVSMYGGLARRDEITPDGFVMVLCHEIGHHLAGFPFVSEWGANEGQSDYFAGLSCARKFWGNETTENARFRTTAPEVAKHLCDEAWTAANDQNLCYRTVVASKSISDLLATLDETTVDLEASDDSIVSETNNDHPAAQCRLDTYVAGALCTATFPEDVIPGKGEEAGENSEKAEKESARYTCTASGGFEIGIRPSCWFHARL